PAPAALRRGAAVRPRARARGRSGLHSLVSAPVGGVRLVTATPPRIRALIVDDEPLARARLRGLLAKHDDMQVVGECVEGSEAIAAIERMHPEVVFLDIQMTETSGLDVATSLECDPRPAVVFVTAHERYALEAFGARALDYLLKPFEEERFLATLERVRTWSSALRAQRGHEHLLA